MLTIRTDVPRSTGKHYEEKMGEVGFVTTNISHYYHIHEYIRYKKHVVTIVYFPQLNDKSAHTSSLAFLISSALIASDTQSAKTTAITFIVHNTHLVVVPVVYRVGPRDYVVYSHSILRDSSDTINITLRIHISTKISIFLIPLNRHCIKNVLIRELYMYIGQSRVHRIH